MEPSELLLSLIEGYEDSFQQFNEKEYWSIFTDTNDDISIRYFKNDNTLYYLDFDTKRKYNLNEPGCAFDKEIKKLIKKKFNKRKEANAKEMWSPHPTLDLTSYANYLECYISISESYINSSISLREATARLKDLNNHGDVKDSKYRKRHYIASPGGLNFMAREDFESEVASGWYDRDINWNHLDESSRDGWMQSAYC